MVVEHRKPSHVDSENPGQFFQRLSLPPSPTSSSLIAQRGSVPSTASGAHNRPHTKKPAAHIVKCSGSTASPSNSPKTAVPSSSQYSQNFNRKGRSECKLLCMSLYLYFPCPSPAEDVILVHRLWCRCSEFHGGIRSFLEGVSRTRNITGLNCLVKP